MTKKQHRLVWTWAFWATLVLLFVLFDDYLAENASWLRWPVLAAVVIAYAIEPSRFENAEAGRENLRVLFDRTPWLKVWASVCAAICFGGAIYVTRSSIHLDDIFGFKIVVIALAVLIGPFVVANERRRYEKYGSGESAP